MTKAETAKLLSVIKLAYPNFNITDAVVKLWHELLQDTPFLKAQEHLRDHIMKYKFPPTIAEIIRYDPLEEGYKQLKQDRAYQEYLDRGGDPKQYDFKSDESNALEPWLSRIE